MRLVTANVKSNPVMTQSHVEHDLSGISLLGGVILWQEIAPQRYKDAIPRIMPRRRHLALGSECPISYKPWYWHTAEYSDIPNMSDAPRDLFPDGFHMTGVILMHKGRKRVSPNRYVSYAVLKQGKNPPVVYVNTHMVSGAWNRRHLLTRAWRRARWDEHFAKQRKLITYFYSKGLTVIGGGDMNRGAMPLYHPAQRWLSQGGIDHLYCVESPKGATVALKESHHATGFYTDHDPRVATIVVRARH